mmetsp:Transcript_27122/g.80453  ORF Transcript_27122/g.80453 Transcript_27122/m.80453 type:complete len:269 (+) Transcript_27122:1344-2150(+)
MLQWRVGVRRLVRVNNDGAGRAAIARFVNVPLPFCTCLGVIELGHLEVAMLVLVHWLQRLVHCLRAVDELWVGFEDLERRAPAAAVPLCDGRQARQQELGRQQLGHRLEQALRRARFRQHRFDRSSLLVDLIHAPQQQHWTACKHRRQVEAGIVRLERHNPSAHRRGVKQHRRPIGSLHGEQVDHEGGRAGQQHLHRGHALLERGHVVRRAAARPAARFGHLEQRARPLPRRPYTCGGACCGASSRRGRRRMRAGRWSRAPRVQARWR